MTRQPSRLTFSALASVVFATILCACGGPAKEPNAASAEASNKGEPSIGEAAAREGGLSMLGGGASRENANRSTEVFAAAKMADGAIRLDGQLKEWPALKSADVVVEGRGPHAEFAVAYDANRIYVGGTISDSHFVRTSRFASSEDHAALILAFPNDRGGFAVYEIGLFAGKPGRSVGAVRYMDGAKKGQSVANAKIVEMNTGHGYDFESSIPWAAFDEARLVRVGLRAAVRSYDAEVAGSIASIVATSSGDATNPDALTALPLESEHAVFDGLLVPKGLTASAPRIDLVTDVTGDEMKERVTVYDKWFVIAGPGYRGGKEFFFRELSSDVTKIEAREVTGRKKSDLIVFGRRVRGVTTHESVEVWSILKGDEPSTVFSQDVKLVAANKKVSNAVRIGDREIDLTTEPATVWDASSFNEPTEAGYDAPLLPWGTVKSRSFKFDGTRFAPSKEVSQAGTVVKATATGAIPEPRLVEPKTPPVTKGGDLSAQLLAQFRSDKGISGADKPQFDLAVHVAEDARAERVVVFGRELVVFGPGFRGGSQYANVSMHSFADPSDIRDVTARDLTGDGAAEIVVRGSAKRKTDSGGMLSSDLTFIYTVKDGAPTRVFAIETSRELGEKRIQGSMQFVPQAGGKGFEMLVQAGRAFGWTEATYPFPEDKSGGAIEPILLPWGSTKSARYVWTGSAFERK